MTEDPDKNEEPKPDDLESLLGGLDLTPSWAKGDPGVSTPPRSERSREGGRGPRKPRPSARRDLQGVRVKPRRDFSAGGGGGGGRGGDSRGGDSRGGDSRGGDFRGGGGPRGGHREPRAPRVPVHVDFIPEKKRLSKVVRVIRRSHRVYPLSVVAEKFMENPAFIAMKYTVKEKDPRAEDFFLYVCRANGMVFTDEQACEQYVIEHGIEANYESTEKEVAPPAGNFVCIGRHRPSGQWIGPPNWHGYQARLQEIRARVAPDTPPEHFAADIEMVHEDEAIEAWKKEVSIQRFYREKRKEAPKEEKPKEALKEEAGEEAREAPKEAPKEVPTAEGGEETPEAEGAAEAAGAEETSAPEEVEDAAAASEEPAPEEEPEVDDRPYEMTRDEVETHFRETYLKRLIGKTRRHILPGYLYDKLTDPSLRSLTDFHLRREHARPNSIMFALRPAFKHMRLHVFRQEGELMVAGIVPNPLPPDLKVTPEIQSIVDHVASHPGCNTQEALKTVSNAVDEVPAETVSHFRWLIEKGHVLEFHDDTLYLPQDREGGTPGKDGKGAT